MLRQLFSTGVAVLTAALMLATPAGADRGPVTETVPTAPVRVAAAAGSATPMAGPIWTLPNCDGRWEEFRVANNASAEHRWQLSPGGSWSSWHSLGGTLLYGDLGVARNTDCRIEVFGVGTDRAAWTTWQTVPGGGPWAGWASIGGILTSAPWMEIFPDRTLGVCAWGNDKPARVWCNKHTQPGASPWSGWFLRS
jgi:hypothetical protein